MKKILYDDSAFNQPYGGVTKYFVELIRHLPDGFQAELCQRTTQNYALQKPPFNIPAATHTQWNFWPWLKVRGKWIVYRFLSRVLRVVPSCEYENRRLFASKLKDGDFDVLHITEAHKYTFEWKLVAGKKPIVMTVHDLIPDMDPKKGKIRRGRAKAFRLADHIIAVSENTKRDIMKMYGVKSEKITVVYHGVETQAFDPSSDSSPLGLHAQPYLLYVGGRRDYKNFGIFAKVAARLMAERGELHVVCTGGRLSESERAAFSAAGVADRVHAMYVPEEALPSLYAHALAFVYPSKYEGFGIPILEAFKAGCPVLLARASCFPEIGGDAAQYFDPENAEELKAQIERIADDERLRTSMISAGRARAREFTWQRCAKETADVYRSLLAAHR